ncbi:hypothetical protein Tco_1177073 [Tanacetum coccineum]
MKRGTKGFTGEDISLFPTIIVQGQTVQGEGSTHPVESHYTPIIAPSTSQQLISQTYRRITRQGFVVPQPRFPTHTHVEDEAVSFGENDRMVRAATTVSSLEAGHDIGNINRTQSMATPPATGSLRTSLAGGPGCHITIRDTPIHTRSEMVFTMPNDLPLLRVNTLGSDEGSMQHKELMELCTKLSKRLTSLEKEVKMTKQTYGAAYTTLITKVKKLEQKLKSRPSVSKIRRLVISSDKEDLVDEHPSKQGRKIAEINQDEGITLVQVDVETQGRYGDDMEFDTSVFEEQEVFLAAKDVTTTKKEDKGKSIMQEFEQPRKIKKKVQVQMSLDEELAQRLHEEEQVMFNEEQELLAREGAEKEVNPLAVDIDWDDVQAQIQADEDLGQRILEDERESLFIKERSRLLAEFIDKRKKLQAA